MRKLSTGDDSTLGNYLKLTIATLGENSKAAEYLRNKIASSSIGENEEVIADERQMVYALLSMELTS